MTSRRRAAAIAIALAVLVVAALVVETARATDRQELVAAAAIRAAFGTGETAGCFMAIADRETGGTFNPRAANWRDRHADGSRGSFGLLQIGALWRDRGETVQHFAARMFDPRANARLARRLFDRYGVQPLGLLLMRTDDDRPELGVVPAGYAICNLCDPRRPIALDRAIAHMRAEHGVETAATSWPDAGLLELEPDELDHAIDCDLGDDCSCGARAAELERAAATDRRRWYGP